MPSMRPCVTCRRSGTPIASADALYQWMVFFEWKAIKGRAKQPYAIAMKDGSPFGLAGIWENWQEPTSDDWIRTFAIITTDSNELRSRPRDSGVGVGAVFCPVFPRCCPAARSKFSCSPKILKSLARPARFELTTSAFGGQRFTPRKSEARERAVSRSRVSRY
jgi:SOS response associated peptidase (SRAP)